MIRSALGKAKRRAARPLVRHRITASGWFDPDWYAARVPDVSSQTALDHYLAVGQAADLDPHPRFDVEAYIAAQPEAAGSALVHFLGLDLAPGARPHDVVVEHAPAVASGWFDAEWYLATNPDLVGSGIRPYAHYVLHGWNERRHPSPFFDVGDYLDLHDPDAAGLDTVAHWLEQQPELGPVASTVRGPDRGPHAIGRHRVRPAAELADLDVVVFIHAFYVDVLPELVAVVGRIPGRPRLLVSVIDEGVVGQVGDMIDAELGADHPRVVRVVPNRGRNFGPMVCSFAAEIAEHEIVLAMHTKKSLYTGREATEWRTDILRHLGRNRATVDSILSCFVDDPTVGIVQPRPFVGIPHWGCHWLGNAGRGRWLYDRFGLDPALADGYLTYPVGGMFWARTAALRPLFDAGLTIDDFEVEAGQTDRTLAHAIERSVGGSARAAGLRTVELDASTGTWRTGWSTRNIDQFATVGPDELEAILAEVDLVSIDLFDTLLLRPSLDAGAVRAQAMRRLRDGGSAWLDRRVEAERRLRISQPTAGDVTLTEIYDELAAAWPDDAETIELVRAEELEVERRTVVARRWLIEELRRLRRPGLRYVLMTDTYLERPMIDELLTRIDAADLFDRCYVSTEVRARKDSGTMWDLVAAEEGCSPERWVHLGDNEFSDVQQAIDRRLSAVHVPSPGATAGVAGFELAAVAPECREATALVAGAGIAAMLAARPTRDAPAIEEFGYGVVGPLTFAFVHWLVQTGRADGVDRFLFAARDGYLPAEMYRRCRDALGGDAPPAGYLLSSRRAAFRLSRSRGSGIDDVLAAGAFRGTIGELMLARLGFDLGDDLAGAVVVTLPGDEDVVREQLADRLAEIEALGASDRPAFERHLADLGVEGGSTVGLVDLGYSATAQRSLDSVVDVALRGYYAVTTRRGSETAGVRSCFAEHVLPVDENLIYDHQRVFEMVWSATHGQVDHLRLDGGSVVPVYDERTERDDRARHVIGVVHEQVMRFADDLLARHGADILTAPLDAAAVSRALEYCRQTLIPEVDGLFADLVLDDHFSGLGNLAMTIGSTPSETPPAESGPIDASPGDASEHQAPSTESAPTDR